MNWPLFGCALLVAGLAITLIADSIGNLLRPAVEIAIAWCGALTITVGGYVLLGWTAAVLL